MVYLKELEIKEKAKHTSRRKYSRRGSCMVDGCDGHIEALQLCKNHYASMRRRSIKEDQKLTPSSIAYCLAAGCNQPHFSNGYCQTHHKTYIKVGYPHLPKTIKICGVDQCSNIHFQKGLCEEHYDEWVDGLMGHGLEYQLNNK